MRKNFKSVQDSIDFSSRFLIYPQANLFIPPIIKVPAERSQLKGHVVAHSLQHNSHLRDLFPDSPLPYRNLDERNSYAAEEAL